MKLNLFGFWKVVMDRTCTCRILTIVHEHLETGDLKNYISDLDQGSWGDIIQQNAKQVITFAFFIFIYVVIKNSFKNYMYKCRQVICMNNGDHSCF